MERLAPLCSSISGIEKTAAFVERLEDKGFVERDRSHAVHFFSPRIGRQAYAAGQLESLANKLTGGSLAPLITHMVEENKLSSDELQRLRDILGEEDE